MERLFEQARAELGLRPDTTLHALEALCDWLDRHVRADHTRLLVRPAHVPETPRKPRDGRLIDCTLTVIESPHAADVSLAMTLHAAGLTLDQVDVFVALFLAHLQLQARRSFEETASRLHEWLDRGQNAGGNVGLPH